jgi:hypothetical protein
MLTIFFIGNPEGVRLPEKLGLRWEDNITVDLREIGWEGVDWMHLVHERDEWRDLIIISSSRRTLLHGVS